ncbi:MAG TPA: VWA domain-containing protein [Dongiaceae bacterium]
MQTKADEYFKALFNRPEAEALKVVATYSTEGGYKLKIDATANVKTDFMQMMGFNKLKVGADSQVAWGNTKLRIGLSLDNTGSMKDNGKMDALKAATKGLLTQLQTAAATNGDVYVSIVPFNKNVNVGDLGNKNSDWLNWAVWDLLNFSCTKKNENNLFDCLAAGGLWLPLSHNDWEGCVTDRDQPYDTTNSAPITSLLASLFVTEKYDDCPAELMALSYDWKKLNKKVDDMEPNGMTNQTIGLQWAFQSLTASPFTIPPKDPNYKYSDIIIHLTDGLNTQNRWSKKQSEIDERTKLVCTNAKAAGVTIYAIQVNTTGDPTQQVLKDCASTPDKFFILNSANQMVSTFQQIGTQLSNLRIAQ